MTCQVEPYQWVVRRGDDATRVFEYLDPDDDPIDLTGASAVCLIDIGLADYSVACTVDGPTGKITAKLEDTMTATFLGDGEFRVRLTQAGGDKLTLVVGALKVLA